MKGLLKKHFSNVYSFAVVGSGPGGIYTAKHLLRKYEDIQVDFYERLPHPFGLVRTGVSPDHQEVKHVEKDFMTLLEDSRIRFLGNVTVGRDINLSTLQKNYSAILLSYGADSENKLGLKNEDSYGMFSARSFVNWYNGHLLYFKNSKFNQFDFSSVSDTIIIGNGNVAIDIARILSKDTQELKKLDMPEESIHKLSQSKVKNIHIIGRRGLTHAAFTIKELRELSKVEGVKIFTNKNEIEESLSSYTGEELNSILPSERRHITRKIEFVKSFTEIEDETRDLPGSKNIFLRFLMTPTEICIDPNNQINGIKFVRNFYQNKNNLKNPLEIFIKSNLIFKSIGYQSVNLFDEIKFDDSKSTLKNFCGVVYDKDEKLRENIFCVGWVKTGPRGIIDSTLRDSYETAESIYKSISNGSIEMKVPDFEFIQEELKSKGIKTVSLEQWKKIDEIEIQEGKKKGKIREKILDIDQMLSKI
jgi:adrenodoxin-NADP+ reductase